METLKSLFSISHDHFHGLMVAQLIKKGAHSFPGLPKTNKSKAKYVIEFYERELLFHFHIEETVLELPLRGINKELDKLFDEMHNEHKNIVKKVEALNKPDNLADSLDDLGHALEEHIQNEEYVLFTKIRDLLSAEQLEKLAVTLKENGYESIYKY